MADHLHDPGDTGEASGIKWQPWSSAAFRRAQQEDKPVILSLSAVWCYWCHVMGETTYLDPDVVSLINGSFVPVQVDNDHRPDLNARYNVGGWPTTAFLTPHGGYVAGATYLPPDQLLAMLLEVRRAYAEDKPGLYDQAAQLQRQRQEYASRPAAGPELTHRLADLIARRMAGAYDPRNGGFGEEPKFPSAPILQFLLHLFRTTGEEFYRAMLRKTLDAVLDGELYDALEGGFFRYCALADWTEAQHEKLLEDNINLARVFLDAGLLLDKPRYTAVAGQTIDYLLAVLYDREAGMFRGSQGAHSDYFGLPPEVRRHRSAPAPDAFCYTNWSCQAASLLLEAGWKLSRPELKDTALSVLAVIWSRAETGALPHALAPDGRPSPHLPAGGDLLCDWAALLNALMDAHNCCPQGSDFLPRAVAAAAELERRFFDPARGVCCDGEPDPEAVGYLRVAEKPLPENVLAAQALLKLHHATGEDQYRLRAESILSAFVEVNRDYGEHAAAYAIAVDHFMHPPLEITIEGPPAAPETGELVAAALKINHPHVVVKPVMDEPPLSGGEGRPALAHVCLDTICFPPVENPQALAVSVAEALEGPPSPFENIFERFAGF